MSLSINTAAALIQAHIEQASAATDRPRPYRERQRRAGWVRLAVVLAAIAAFAMPLIGSY